MQTDMLTLLAQQDAIEAEALALLDIVLPGRRGPETFRVRVMHWLGGGAATPLNWLDGGAWDAYISGLHAKPSARAQYPQMPATVRLHFDRANAAARAGDKEGYVREGAECAEAWARVVRRALEHLGCVRAEGWPEERWQKVPQ